MEVEKLASVKIDTSFEEFCSDGCKGVGWQLVVKLGSSDNFIFMRINNIIEIEMIEQRVLKSDKL